MAVSKLASPNPNNHNRALVETSTCLEYPTLAVAVTGSVVLEYNKPRGAAESEALKNVTQIRAKRDFFIMGKVYQDQWCLKKGALGN